MLEGKLVVVTGAGRGQGAAEASAVLRAGGRVVALDLETPGESLAAGVPGAEERLVRRSLDVSDEAAWSELAGELAARLGPVHGLVNTAGVTDRSRLGSVSRAAWDRVFAVNVTGAMLAIQALAPLMPPGSSVVNVGSLAAVNAHYTAAYTASKWALRGLSRVASLELGRRQIRVNLVNPGYIETEMTASAPESFVAANLANTPLGRLGRVDDVVPLVLFLLSEASGFISGAEIPVDGGQGAHAGAKAVSDALLAAAPPAAPPVSSAAAQPASPAVAPTGVCRPEG